MYKDYIEVKLRILNYAYSKIHFRKFVKEKKTIPLEKYHSKLAQEIPKLITIQLSQFQNIVCTFISLKGKSP